MVYVQWLCPLQSATDTSHLSAHGPASAPISVGASISTSASISVGRILESYRMYGVYHSNSFIVKKEFLHTCHKTTHNVTLVWRYYPLNSLFSVIPDEACWSTEDIMMQNLTDNGCQRFKNLNITLPHYRCGKCSLQREEIIYKRCKRACRQCLLGGRERHSWTSCKMS